MDDAPELKPCPFCGDTMKWNHGGGYASHQDYIKPCPIRNQGFSDAGTWNTRADLAAARVAEALDAGVRAGLLAAAFEASLHAAEMEHDQRHGGAMDVLDTIRAIAADPAQVAAIAASVKGGANG